MARGPATKPVLAVADDPARRAAAQGAGSGLRPHRLSDPGHAEAQALQWVENFRNGSDLAALAGAARDQIAERTEAEPPARILLYIDQGEELYARAEAGEAKRFSELLAGAADQPDISILASLRSDYYGRLQDDAPLFAASDRIDVPPLTRAEIEDVIRKPATQLGARFETPEIVPMIAGATASESWGLPLLSYMMAEAWEASRCAVVRRRPSAHRKARLKNGRLRRNSPPPTGAF